MCGFKPQKMKLTSLYPYKFDIVIQKRLYTSLSLWWLSALVLLEQWRGSVSALLLSALPTSVGQAGRAASVQGAPE